MAHDAKTVEELTALYESQSPAAFIAFAMEGLPDDFEHDERFDKGSDLEHGGDSKCDYCCCSEGGGCTSAAGYVGIVVCVVVLCICCCYVTNGFDGVWTYWPFRRSA